jgi:hypothetical protein
MLAFPAASPPEPLKRLHFRVSIRPKGKHHAGAGIDTPAAFRTLIFIQQEMCFLFRPTESLLSSLVLHCHNNLAIHFVMIHVKKGLGDRLKGIDRPYLRRDLVTAQEGKNVRHGLPVG